MPIQIPVPQTFEKSQYQLLAEILRRAVDGSIPIPDGTGIVLASPNGTKYRLGVADDGSLTTTAV